MLITNKNILEYYKHTKSNTNFKDWYEKKYIYITNIFFYNYHLNIIINYSNSGINDVIYLENYKKFLKYKRKEKILNLI